MIRKILIEIICFALTLLFVYAALSKLIIYDTFRQQVSQYPFLGDLGWLLPWFIPTLELCISVLLALSRFRNTGLLISFMLLSGFWFTSPEFCGSVPLYPVPVVESFPVLVGLGILSLI